MRAMPIERYRCWRSRRRIVHLLSKAQLGLPLVPNRHAFCLRLLRQAPQLRVKAEFLGDVEAAVRAQIAIVLQSQAEVEETHHAASPTDALPNAADVAELPPRRRTQVDSFDPSTGWSAFERDRLGQRHDVRALRDNDFSRASREQLNAMHARVVDYMARLQAQIDLQYPPAKPSPPPSPSAAKRQRVLAAASARMRAGQELRELLTQVKLLERPPLAHRPDLL